MILLSNATGCRGVAYSKVKITEKEFTPCVMLAVDWELEICDSDTLLHAKIRVFVSER
jgi:hypothetical protein